MDKIENSIIYYVKNLKLMRRTNTGAPFLMLRGSDSNRRPLGYEPNELPLLHPAIYSIPNNEKFKIAGTKVYILFVINKFFKQKMQFELRF